MKDSSGDWSNAEALLKHHGDLHILIGDERLLARAMTLGASGAISGMLNVIPDLMQPLLDGIEEPRVNAMVEAVLAHPVTAAVKALVGLRRNDPVAWSRMRAPLASLGEAESASSAPPSTPFAASARLSLPDRGHPPLRSGRAALRAPDAREVPAPQEERQWRHRSPSGCIRPTTSSWRAWTSCPAPRSRARSPPPRACRPGHKILTRAVKQGEPLRKYNQIIGFATEDLPPGAHIHTHNCVMGDFERDYAFCADARPTDYIAPAATFMGYRRADGRAATRNYIGIVTTVNCSAATSRMIAGKLEPLLAQYPNIDGVVPLTHGGGCGMAASGLEMDVLRRTLAGYTRHPNMAAVVVLGLGCETNQISGLMNAEGLKEGPKLIPMAIQDEGGVSKTVMRAVGFLKELLPEANDVKREPIPASELILALQCGGSDGYSGISANPALGAAVDLLVRHGGTAVLSETPEIYGAEHLLTRRAVSREVGEKIVRAHQMVGRPLRAHRRRDEQQSLARQQGGRAHHHPREILGCSCEGRHDQPGRRLRIRPADHRQGLRLHGFAGLRPGLGHRPGGGRRQCAVLHDRPRQRVRLQAHPVTQACDE